MEQGKSECRGKRAEDLELRAVRVLFSALCWLTCAHTNTHSHTCEQASVGVSVFCIKSWRARACVLWSIFGIWLPCPSLLRLSSSADPSVSEGFEMSSLHAQAFHWKLCFPHRRPDYNVSEESALENPPLEGCMFCFLCDCSKVVVVWFSRWVRISSWEDSSQNLHFKAHWKPLEETHTSEQPVTSQRFIATKENWILAYFRQNKMRNI